MRADYQSADSVRRMRWIGWGVTAVLGLAIVVSLAWKIAQTSERRAMAATREHLVASLNSLVAEQVAKGQVLGASWRQRNPFVLLRWPQDNYCGELAVGDAPQGGCWYWLPSKAWVMHRARFADGWPSAQADVRAWRLLAVPGERSAASQSASTAFALELEAVSAAQLAAAGY